MTPPKVHSTEESQKVGLKEANQRSDKHACAPVNSEAKQHEHGDDQPRHPQHASSLIDRQLEVEFEPGTAFDSGSDCQRPRSMSDAMRTESQSPEVSTPPSEPEDSPIISRRHNLELKAVMKSASIHPPVTKQSLSELDINRVISNIKLRHDVNFDRELHFRPNLDGEKGRRKLEQAEGYWKALVAEFVMCLSANEPPPSLRKHYHNVVAALQEQPITNFGDVPKRIPLMFGTISDILKTLVPLHHHSMIDERLDLPVLLQQINKGLCDFTGLSRWLAGLLKAHCAPMRDEWVENMEEQIGRGVKQADLGAIVEGLKLLFGILETMKLDVANHQIRSLRPLLIEDTVDFEQRYFLRRIASQRLDVRRSAEWFTNAEAHAHVGSSLGTNDRRWNSTVVFTENLVHSLFASPQNDNLQTFAFDQSRLDSLRTEIRDLIHLETCSRLFSVLTRYLEYAGSAQSTIILKLRKSIISIVRPTSTGSWWQQNLTNVALEIVRTAHRVSSSEIFTDLDLVDFAENYLRKGLDVESAGYRQVGRAIEQALIPMVLDRINSYSELSPLMIYDYSTPGKDSRASDGAVQDLEDVSKLVAHIGTLHWRVWGPLVYLRSTTNRSEHGRPERE